MSIYDRRGVVVGRSTSFYSESQPIANKHYRQATDEHFTRATKALQQALQHGAQQKVTECNDPGEAKVAEAETPENRDPIALDYLQCASGRKAGMGGTGLEPTPDFTGKTQRLKKSGAKSGAL